MDNADFPAWLESAMLERVVVRINYSKPSESDGRRGVVVIEAMTYQTTSFFTFSRYIASEPLTARCYRSELETKWFVCAADLRSCLQKQWADTYPCWFESQQVVITEGFGPKQVIKKWELGWRELSHVCLLLGRLRERFPRPFVMGRFETHEKRLAGLTQECLDRLRQACQLLAD